MLDWSLLHAGAAAQVKLGVKGERNGGGGGICLTNWEFVSWEV